MNELYLSLQGKEVVFQDADKMVEITKTAIWISAVKEIIFDCFLFLSDFFQEFEAELVVEIFFDI